MKNTIAFALIVLATAAQLTAADTPVTSTVSDTYNDVQNGIPLSIRSDGAGAYPNSRNVQSILQDCGTNCRDWVLQTDFNRNSTRKIFLDFTNPVNGPAPFPTALVGARFIVKAHEYGVNMLTMVAEESRMLNLAISFSYGGSSYRLAFNEKQLGSELVNVTCLTADAGGCSLWTVASAGLPNDGLPNDGIDDTAPKTVGKLLKILKTGTQDMGNYYFSLNVKVTRP